MIQRFAFPANRRRLVFAALAAAMLTVPAVAQTPVPEALSTLEKGAWLLRDRSTGTRTRICLRTGRELIQLRHSQPGCRQTVVQDSPRQVTIHYTCEGNGYGRTSVRLEDERLVQVRSQGIINGAPFTIDGEARRTGNC